MKHYEITVARPCPKETEKICEKKMFRISMGMGVTYAFKYRWQAEEAETGLKKAGAKFIKNGKSFVPKEKE